MSEKKSNLLKQKERIKKMQQMYNFGKNEKEEQNNDNEKDNPGIFKIIIILLLLK